MSLVGFLGKLRISEGLSKAELGRRMAALRQGRGESDVVVSRNDVYRWESGEVRIRIEDVSDWLNVVRATPEQRLRALDLANGGGHADHPTETEGQAKPPAPRPVVPASVPTPEPQEVREVSDARPVVGTCGRSSCGGPLHALIEGDVWRGVRCDDCELETDLERARPAAEAVQGAYRRGAA